APGREALRAHPGKPVAHKRRPRRGRSAVALRPLRGRSVPAIRTGGFAALNHRLMAATPPGSLAGGERLPINDPVRRSRTGHRGHTFVPRVRSKTRDPGPMAVTPPA